MKTKRYLVGDLELDTALHIGVGKGGSPTDSPLRRTGDGRLVIPGRALGGALRTIATRLAPRLGMPMCWVLLPGTLNEIQAQQGRQICGCPVCQLFGELYPDEDDSETGGAPSQLWISDAFAKNGDLNTHIRDGVGIARADGAAARNVKYDYEIAPRGTHFGLRLKLLDDDSDAAKTHAMLLAAALEEWREGRGRLGGGAARGLGRFTLKNFSVNELALQTVPQVIEYLKSDAPWTLGVSAIEWYANALQDAQKQAQSPSVDPQVAHSFVTLEFEIAIESPFIINDPLVGALTGFDHAPLLEFAADHAGAPVLSGSSLRGVLRSRAEKIARTLATIQWKQGAEFLKHCPACDPFANQPSAPLANCDRRLNIADDKEVGEESLCLACRLFGSPRRGSRLWIEDAAWNGGALDANQWHAQDFLAIDRFTGGGRDGAKFDAAPLTRARFAARLTLHNPSAWELGWLMFVLRDLQDGEMTIGFGAAKGYGRARSSDFKWSIGYFTDNDLPGLGAQSNQTRSGVFHISRANGFVPPEWKDLTQTWVGAFKNAAENFEMSREIAEMQADTFFSATDALYDLPWTRKEQNG